MHRRSCPPREPRVVVVGGGPAGVAAAVTLARAGARVRCLDADERRPERTEIWAAAVGEALQRLALRSVVAGHASACGLTRSLWGPGPARERLGFLDPRGDEWIVERHIVGRRLRDALSDHGVTVHEGARLAGLERVAAGWRIAWQDGDGRSECTADAWIDATGARAIAARMVGARRLTFDRHIGVSGRWEARDADVQMTGVLALEPGAAGWWYVVGGEGSRLDAVWMTDADLVGGGASSLGATLAAALADTRALRMWVRDEPVGVAVVAARLACLDRATGDGWCAVGDAAIQLDPLCGAGAYHAVQDGIAGAEALLAQLGGDPSAGPRHQARCRARLETHLRERWQVYAHHGRDARLPYWHRRSGVESAGGLVDPARRWRATEWLTIAWERSGLPFQALRGLTRGLASGAASSFEIARHIREATGASLSDAWIVAAIGRLRIAGGLEDAIR